jgi:hypothetical protein
MEDISREIDRTIVELLNLRHSEYVGVDVRMRIGDPTEFSVYRRGDRLPEETTDDDITRLKEKLELLEKIRKMQKIIEKFNEEHPQFVPIRYPNDYPWQPWPPRRIWNDDNTGTPYWKGFDVFCSSSDGERFW